MRKLLIGILALAVLVGCNEAKKSRGTANARGTRSQTPGTPGGTQNTLQNLNCTGDAWGLIFDDQNNDQMWQYNVKLFASASVNYQDIGTVSGLASSNTTGISFCGRVCQNTNSNNSEVYVGIWDQKFVDGDFDSEISVNIKSGGLYNGKLLSQTANSSAIFNDDFGSVEFRNGSTGTDGKVSGEFYFFNKTILGNAPPEQRNRLNQAHKLGRFSIRAQYFWNSGC